MNALCSSDLETADQVFATLDPVARKLMLPDGQQLILIDTWLHQEAAASSR
jgi:GTP-binding protein HflX